jgi:DNA-binding transcriptional MerR regulator
MSPVMSAVGRPEQARAMEKSPDAFRTISEVADDLDLPQHVLRFWETRFAQIKPLKRGGGRRYYRPDDVDLLKGIRHLLYGEGYTIKGVQRILKEDGIRFVQAIGRGEQSVEAPPAGAAPEEPVEDEGTAAVAVAASARPGTTAAAPSPARLALPPEGRIPQMLPKTEIARLKAVLDELLECERVLSTLTPPDSSDDELSRG